jgi:hypothetical protein
VAAASQIAFSRGADRMQLKSCVGNWHAGNYSKS